MKKFYEYKNCGFEINIRMSPFQFFASYYTYLRTTESAATVYLTYARGDVCSSGLVSHFLSPYYLYSLSLSASLM